MTSLQHEDHMIYKQHKSTYPSHGYPHATSPSRAKSQKLAALITKFETLDLKGKAFSQPEMQPLPLLLPRHREYIDREKGRLLVGHRDMDLEMEMQMRGVDVKELENFANELQHCDTRSAEKTAGNGGNSLTAAKDHAGSSGLLQRRLDENSIANTPIENATIQKKGARNYNKLPLPADLPTARKIPEIPMAPGRSSNFNKSGSRRESKILDRIRMFDGSMELTSKSPTTIITKEPADAPSSTPNQRIVSAQRNLGPYTPSSVRNSYVGAGRSATKTPTKSVGKIGLTWTPASKDSRSRKKELYGQSQSQGRTREQAQSSNITAGIPMYSQSQERTRDHAQSSTVIAAIPLRANPPAAEQLHSQHQLIHAWEDQPMSSYREQNLKTPTPASRGPSGYVALDAPTPGSLNRSARNGIVRKMAKSKTEIREKIGRVIEARVNSIKSLDPVLAIALTSGKGKDDRVPLIDKDDSPQRPASLAESAIEEYRNFTLEKEMEILPLRIAAQKVKYPTKCCDNGSPPSRKVSREIPGGLHGDTRPSGLEVTFPEDSKDSKLTEKISMFEKVSIISPSKRKITPIKAQAVSSHRTPCASRDKSETKAPPKTPSPPESIFGESCNPFLDRHNITSAISIASEDEDEELRASVMRDRERIMDTDEDKIPLVDRDVESIAFPDLPAQKPENFFGDSIFNSPPKFNTRRTTMPHTIVERPQMPLKPPVKIKTGSTLMDRIKIWESRSQAADKESAPFLKNEMPLRHRRKLSNSKSWIKSIAGGGSGREKFLDCKGVADVVTDVGREMNVSVVSRDVTKTREAWLKKESREDDMNGNEKPLRKVFCRYYEVSGPSPRKGLRRSTVHGGSEARNADGLSDTRDFSREQIEKDSKEVPLVEQLADFGRARDGSLSIPQFDDPKIHLLSNPLRQNTPPSHLKDQLSKFDAETKRKVSKDVKEEPKKIEATQINDLINAAANLRKDDNESRGSISYSTKSFTERFMKGLIEGKPKTIPESIIESPAAEKKNAPTATESRLPSGRLRYPKMYNMQGGNFVQQVGENSQEEAVFAFSPLESQDSSGKSREFESEREAKNVLSGIGNTYGGNANKSRWSLTDSTVASTISPTAGDEGFATLHSGETWLGARSERFTEISEGSRKSLTFSESWWSENDKDKGIVRKPLLSPEAIEIGDSSSELDAAARDHECEDMSRADLGVSLSAEKSNTEEAKEEEYRISFEDSSLSKEESIDSGEANEDDEEFDVVEELEGSPVLLGKRIKSGMLVQPQPRRAAEKERLVELCNRSSWSSVAKKRGEGSGS